MVFSPYIFESFFSEIGEIFSNNNDLSISKRSFVSWFVFVTNELSELRGYPFTFHLPKNRV